MSSSSEPAATPIPPHALVRPWPVSYPKSTYHAEAEAEAGAQAMFEAFSSSVSTMAYGIQESFGQERGYLGELVDMVRIKTGTT